MNKEELEAAMKALRDRFEKEMARHQRDFSIKQKLLSDCLSNHVDLVDSFERLGATAAYLEKEAESLRDLNHSYAFSKIVKGPKKIMSTDAKKLADCDGEYVESVIQYNAIYKLKREIDAVRETMIARGYALKSHTDALKAGVSSAIL